jgi:hypothetical protein
VRPRAAAAAAALPRPAAAAAAAEARLACRLPVLPRPPHSESRARLPAQSLGCSAQAPPHTSRIPACVRHATRTRPHAITFASYLNVEQPRCHT